MYVLLGTREQVIITIFSRPVWPCRWNFAATKLCDYKFHMLPISFFEFLIVQDDPFLQKVQRIGWRGGSTTRNFGLPYTLILCSLKCAMRISKISGMSKKFSIDCNVLFVRSLCHFVFLHPCFTLAVNINQPGQFEVIPKHPLYVLKH